MKTNRSLTGGIARLLAICVLASGPATATLPDLTPEELAERRCAGKMGLAMVKMKQCVAKAQALEMLRSGDDCGTSVSVATCIAGAVDRLQDAQKSFAPNCALNAGTTEAFTDLATIIAFKAIDRTRVLVAGTYSCP